jgi:hypothetical protein
VAVTVGVSAGVGVLVAGGVGLLVGVGVIEGDGVEVSVVDAVGGCAVKTLVPGGSTAPASPGNPQPESKSMKPKTRRNERINPSKIGNGLF